MPLQNLLVAEAHQRLMRSGQPDVVPMPAGQIVGRISEIRPVAEVIESLVAETDAGAAAAGRTAVRIAVTAGYWGAGPPPGAAELFDAAERLGIDQVWTAEAYGSDAWTPLAWYGSRTSRVQLGTAVSQLSARPPATLAMTAMTMDHLTQGRVLLGLGTSNPQVVEGWYGQPYPRPLERTREYVDILRKVIAREEPVSYDGKHYQLPLAAGTGLGKPLRSILHPYRTEIPVYLGAEGPKNVALAAEIADGWLPMFFSPAMNDFYATALAEGFARPGARRSAATFDVVGGPLGIVPDDDLERAADRLRPSLALYIGGMGARGVNFHYEVFARMGYEAQARTIQDHYLAGDKKGAIAAVPTRDGGGRGADRPLGQDRRRDPALARTVLTTFLASCDLRLLEKVADLVRPIAQAGAPRCRDEVAEAAELRRGAAEGELGPLGRGEVPVHGVRRVDAHPAVHVDGGVRDPVARVRGPELGGGDRGGDRGVVGRPSASSQAACHIVSQTASTSM